MTTRRASDKGVRSVLRAFTFLIRVRSDERSEAPANSPLFASSVH